MRPELYKEVALTRSIPEENLKKGDTGWYIEYLSHPKGGEDGAILEIFDADGDSRIVTVPISAIEATGEDEIPAVRSGKEEKTVKLD